MAAVVILLFLAALAFCGWGFWQSCKLMGRGLSRIFSPTTQGTQGTQGSPTVPLVAVSPSTRLPVPDWTDKLVADHLATCGTCRLSYVEGTLSLLEPETIKRILAIIETEDKAVAP